MTIYLSQYVGDGTKQVPFRVLGSEYGAEGIDLRPDGGATLDGHGLNTALVHAPTRLPDDSRLILLGESPDESLSASTRKVMASRLGVMPQGDTLKDGLTYVLQHQKVCNPFQPGYDGVFRASLGSTLLTSLSILPGSAGLLAASLMSKQAWNRRKILQAAGLGGILLSLPRIAWAALPATDNFNRSNGALGANWTQTTGEDAYSIVSNVINCVEALDSGHFWNADTWPNDQYSQIKLVTLVGGSSGGGEGNGIGIRIASGARTYYRTVMNAAASNNVSIDKQVAGSYTQITTRTQAFSANGVLYASVVGSTITVKWQGATLGATVTDSSVTTGSAGLSHSSTITSFTADDWEGGSAAMAATTRRRRPILF